MDLLAITDELIKELEPLQFKAPVTHVYNPLVYARASFEKYIRKYGRGRREIVLLGMNPGPWGMAQTGVPFGEISLVREWLKLEAPVGKPEKEHPKRPIQGFDCPRSEVSGQRLWSWAKDRYGDPKVFFKRFFIYNYCPLCFMEESGRNRTPDKLPLEERKPLLEACDRALERMLDYFKPQYAIGIGNFAEKRILQAIPDPTFTIGRVPHPSPASPLANRGWPEAFEAALHELGIKI